MTMDWGGYINTSKTMGGWTIQSAQSTVKQLAPLYASYGHSFGYANLGLCPMIGQNDVRDEVFTVADAQAVRAWAPTVRLRQLTFYSINRDTPGTDYLHTSGTTAPAFAYSQAFNTY